MPSKPLPTQNPLPSTTFPAKIGLDQNVEVLHAAMLELYGALDNDLHVLAAIGIRTSYDIASELLGIDPNLSFGKKLDALISSGRIGIVDKERIETVIDAGSASAHRGWKPTPSDLATMMDVLEHFIYESFVVPEHKAKLDAEAAKVKKTVPLRPVRTNNRSTLKKTDVQETDAALAT